MDEAGYVDVGPPVHSVGEVPENTINDGLLSCESESIIGQLRRVRGRPVFGCQLTYEDGQVKLYHVPELPPRLSCPRQLFCVKVL
jgi:hypothetical protein